MTDVTVWPSEIDGSIQAAPSKSYTHRFAALALLARGSTRIERPLISRDTHATFEACKAFGAQINQEDINLDVIGVEDVKLPNDVLNAENSGTTIRFFSSIASLVGKGFTVLTGDETIRRRPMQPLLDALIKLGVKAFCTRGNGCPPVVVGGNGLRGGETELAMEVSSQYLSGLLIACCRAKGETRVKLTGAIVSKPYLEATLKSLELFGGIVENRDWQEFVIQGDQALKPTTVTVPGDFGSAAFMLALGGLAGKVRVLGIPQLLPQADARILFLLRELGFPLHVEDDRCICSKYDFVDGGRFNLADCPDLLPVLAVLGLRSEHGLRLEGVRHARFKESDRIALLAQELSKIGAEVKESEDGLVIRRPERIRVLELDSHGDHRLLMAFSLIPFALGRSVTIRGAECIDVSYPKFFEDLRSLGVHLEVAG